MRFAIKGLKVFDIPAILLAVALIVVVGVLAYSDTDASSHVQLHADGGEWLYSLENEKSLEVEGPLGTTFIEIQDGAARVISSPCAEKICVKRGTLDAGGDWTACLPNRIFIRITGDEKADIDALSY